MQICACSKNRQGRRMTFLTRRGGVGVSTKRPYTRSILTNQSKFVLLRSGSALTILKFKCVILDLRGLRDGTINWILHASYIF